jgi:hypothetical protein
MTKFVRDEGQHLLVLAIAERLLRVSVDELISYDELAKVAKVDLREKRYLLDAARKTLSKNHGVLFSPEYGVGYRRLGSAAGVGFAGSTGMKRTRNAARKGKTNLVNAMRTANLSPEESRAANQQLCSFGMIDFLAQPRIIQTLPETTPLPDDTAGIKSALGLAD